MSATSTAFIPLLLGAVADQEAGRWPEAERGFDAVLELEPEQPQALLFAGVLAMRTGRPARASELLQRAVAARPGYAEVHFAYGNALWADGHRGPARVAWQQAIRLEPTHVGALLNLAQAEERSGEAELAVAHCRAAIAAQPESPAPWSALASALCSSGEAAEALQAADAALACDDAFGPAHHHRGMALKALGRTEDAAQALRRAVQHQPGSASSHLNLANLLHDLGDTEAAERHCRAAIQRDPALAEAHTVLGFLLTQTGDLDGAIAACNRALAIEPELPEAQWNLGIALLTGGDLPAGFARYEWRKRHPVLGREFFALPDPEWTGQPLAGSRIVVMAEQGLGDAIMFARYGAVLAERGATVAIACDRRLVPLLRRTPGVTEVLAKRRDMPRFDFWVDQMSLPHLCGTTADTIPSPGPYLSADPEASQRWSTRLAGLSGRRVGVAWAGNPLHSNDRNRSCPPAVFRDILRSPGLAGVSLQVGGSAGAAAELELRDWSAALVDYGETAALIDQLDLVITVDTSVAHVAAALGKPTWILLPHCPEWRWLRDRSDTPWYDCVRLFRQPRPGDWAAVRDAVRAALASPPA